MWIYPNQYQCEAIESVLKNEVCFWPCHHLQSIFGHLDERWVVKGTLQFFTYDCPMYFSFLMIGRGWAPVGLGSGGAGGQINDDVRSPFGPISWQKISQQFPLHACCRWPCENLFCSFRKAHGACQGLSRTPLLSFAPVKCLISGKFHWAKQAIIDAVQNSKKRQICQKQFTTKVGIGF